MSPDYVATGETGDLRAFIYGGKTVLDVGGRVAWLSVFDAEGRMVPVEKIGRYYRAGVRLDAFTVRLNLQLMTFKAVPATPAAQPAAAVASTQALATERLTPLRMTIPQDSGPGRLSAATETYAMLNACAAKLAEVRRAVDAAPKADAKARMLRVRLEQLEGELLDATARQATLIVNFDRMSTTLRMTDATSRMLIAAARSASQISVRGRTDSVVAGPDDARIAEFRAAAARDFLVDHGVDPSRITVMSSAAGEFLVPNGTEKGKALNRRVEIELRREAQAART
ncbi:MAG: OmpA family protein [Sphingomicrobium sp.]